MTEPANDEVAALVAAAKGNATASERLTRTVREAFKPFRLILWGLVLIGVLQLFGTAMQLYGTWNLIDGRNTSRANQEIIKQTQETLLDCTTPGGECTKRSGARTAEVVVDLLQRMAQAQIEIAGCTYQPDEDEFEVCAAAAMAKLSAMPDPS